MGIFQLVGIRGGGLVPTSYLHYRHAMRAALMVATALLIGFLAGAGTVLQRDNPIYALMRWGYSVMWPTDPVSASHYRQRVHQFERLETASRVVMIGDSITAHGEWNELFPGRGVVNRGISADTAAGVLARSDQLSGAVANFLMIGINDILSGRPAHVVAADVEQLISRLRAAPLFLQSTLLTANNTGANESVSELNRLMRTACEEAAHCAFVDLNALLALDGRLRSDLTFDGLHLNGEAYGLWQQTIAPMIDQVSPPSL